jgi:hypothetical protein
MGSVLRAVSGLGSPRAYLLIAVLACAEPAALAGLVIPGEEALLPGGFLTSAGRSVVASRRWLGSEATSRMLRLEGDGAR